MPATHIPLPRVGYQRDHEGSWTLYRDGMRIGRMDRDLESRMLTVMVDNLFWNLDGDKLQAHGGMAVKSFNKRMGLKLICIHVAFALREMEAGGELQPATIAPRAKPKITIDLDQPPAPPFAGGTIDGVTLKCGLNEGLMRLVCDDDTVLLTHAQARAAWGLLGAYLAEKDGAAAPAMPKTNEHPSVVRDRKERAAAALRHGLAAMWTAAHDTPASDDNIMDMGEALADLLEIRR